MSLALLCIPTTLYSRESYSGSQCSWTASAASTLGKDEKGAVTPAKTAQGRQSVRGPIPLHNAVEPRRFVGSGRGSLSGLWPFPHLIQCELKEEVLEEKGRDDEKEEPCEGDWDAGRWRLGLWP